MAEIEDSKLDMLSQLEDAQRDLMRALELLDEPVVSQGIVNGSSSFLNAAPSPVRFQGAPVRPVAAAASALSAAVQSTSDSELKASFLQQVLRCFSSIWDEDLRFL